MDKNQISHSGKELSLPTRTRKLAKEFRLGVVNKIMILVPKMSTGLGDLMSKGLCRCDGVEDLKKGCHPGESLPWP
jgi:hypothetical protein